MPKRRISKRHKRLIFGTVLASVLAIGIALVIVAESKLSRLVVGGLGELFSTKVYSSCFEITSDATRPIVRSSPEVLMQRLKRLGYRQTFREPRTSGEFFWSAPKL